MNKKLYFLIPLLLLTGCSVKYNINIYEDLSIDEKIAIETSDNSSSELIEIFDTINNDELSNYATHLNYSKKDNEYNFISNVNFNDINNYNSFSVPNTYYNSLINITKTNENKYTITGQNLADIFDKSKLNKLIVSIKLPFKVTDNNSTRKTDNTYYWDITEENKYNNINISFDLSNTNIKKYKIHPFKINIIPVIIVLTLIALFSIIGFFYIKHLNKKNNKL